MGMPHLKIINTSQGYTQKYEDLLSQEILCILWDPMINYRVWNIPQSFCLFPMSATLIQCPPKTFH